ncbi:MAG: molybdate ABC transporter permease subunit [Caldilineaceae bacterium]|nr:molybdate ABC transporter permease subunit [Caldilineaceae bacterium]
MLRPRWTTWSLATAATIMLALITLPLIALLWRALQGLEIGVWSVLQGAVFDAVGLSLETTAISMVWVVLLGTPLAYVLARYRFPLKRLVSLLVELPIVMPPVVAGLALLMAFGRRGLLGPALENMGITLPFTPAAIIVAQIFVSSPFFIRSVQLRFAAIPRELEEAAAIDGASGLRLFWRITLPLSRRALLAGLMLSWSRALGEFGATILFAGNLRGRTQTMPLLVYGALEQDFNAALWTGVILIGLAVVTLAGVQLLDRFFSDGDDADPLGQL